MAEAKYFHIQEGQGLQRMDSLAAALAAKAMGGYVWLDFRDPTRPDLEAIAEPLGIHPLTVEDCLDEDQIPKIEDFATHTFIIFNEYKYADKRLTVAEVDLLVGERFLVTVRGHGSPGHDAPGNGAPGTSILDHLEAAADRQRKSVEKGPDFLLHLILDRIVDGKLLPIEALEADIETAEEGLLKDVSGFQLEDLVLLRHALLALRKSLFHEREILMKICRLDSPFVSEPTIFHFRDIYDHLVRFFELCEMNRDILTSLMEMYLSLVNNRMADIANRTNANVRRLTLITTILMPMSLVSGIGGMSEWSMMTGSENWRLAYPALLVALGLLGWVTYRFVKWIERRDLRKGNAADQK